MKMKQLEAETSMLSWYNLETRTRQAIYEAIEPLSVRQIEDREKI